MAKQVVDPGQEGLIDQQTSAVGPGLTSITQEEALAQQAYRDAHPELYAYVPIDSGGFSLGQILGTVLAVASIAVPGIGSTIGAAILEAVGITGVAPAVAASVGSAALSAASTAAQGGSVEDVLKSAVGTGVASGLNVGLGGGVTGAAAGSAAGTLIKGGTEDQILTNALAAGVGAGVQGALPNNPDVGKVLGTAARTYIATGGNVDQTLLNTAATAIGAANQPDKTAQQLQVAATPLSDAEAAKQIEAVTQSDAARQQELADYQEKLNQYAIDKAVYEQTYGPIAAQPPATASATAPAAEATLVPQTIAATASAPVVTDLGLVKKVAEQPAPTVDAKTLEKVIVQGQKEVAPVETGVTVPVQTTNAPAASAEVTKAPEKLFEPGFEAYPSNPKLESVNIQGYSDKPAEVVTDVSTPVAPIVSPVPTVVPPVASTPKTTELEKVTVSANQEPAPVVTDVVLPPVAPVAPTAPTSPVPQVAPAAAPAEPAKTTLYPTVTGVTSSTSTAPVSLTQSTQTDATANSTNATKTSSTIPTFRVGDLGKYLSPLASYEALVQQMYNTAMDEKVRQQPKESNVDNEFWGYGKQPKPIESMFDLYTPEVTAATGGSIAALLAAGGASKTGIGSTALVPHSGKMRVDFRHGDAVTGPGDGQSDDIPAMLADGEYVLDAEIVSALGNGSTKAGSQLLDEFRHHIRSHKRSGALNAIPPKAKSPLEYLSMARKSIGKK